MKIEFWVDVIVNGFILATSFCYKNLFLKPSNLEPILEGCLLQSQKSLSFHREQFNMVAHRM